MVDPGTDPGPHGAAPAGPGASAPTPRPPTPAATPAAAAAPAAATASAVSAAAIVARLGLRPHPEGGWYAETWRHDPSHGGRGAGTAIYYLLA
ncbi:MAG TPA: cupin domain-containing protein, partial [Acidimicrobiales bacterium]